MRVDTVAYEECLVYADRQRQAVVQALCSNLIGSYQGNKWVRWDLCR